jgi:signal transduction histidine kinase
MQGLLHQPTASRFSTLRARLVLLVLLDEPPPETRTMLYRIALEALSNVRKHAEAGSIE